MNEKEILNIMVKPGPFKIDEIKPGEIQKWGNRWYLACPRCGMVLGLDHAVVVVDGMVTINPSVGHETCRLHMYVRNGKTQYLGDI